MRRRNNEKQRLQKKKKKKVHNRHIQIRITSKPFAISHSTLFSVVRFVSILEIRLQKSRELAETQLEQLHHSRLKKMLERQEEIRDGVKLKKIAADAIVDAELEQQRMIRRQQSMNQEYLRANKEQEQIKLTQKQQEALEDEKIAQVIHT